MVGRGGTLCRRVGDSRQLAVGVIDTHTHGSPRETERAERHAPDSGERLVLPCRAKSKDPCDRPSWQLPVQSPPTIKYIMHVAKIFVF